MLCSNCHNYTPALARVRCIHCDAILPQFVYKSSAHTDIRLTLAKARENVLKNISERNVPKNNVVFWHGRKEL